MDERLNETGAWLDSADGQRFPVPHNCCIGRSRNNQVVLPDMRVSRRHALIQMQGPGEFWIVDFGTVNGTRLDGRRIAMPTRLRDGAVIEIGDLRLVFHHPAGWGPRSTDSCATQGTLGALRQLPVWLLIVDIVDSSAFYRSFPPDELPRVIGPWFATCREVMESSSGVINQYLGDGFFGHWPDGKGVPEKVAGALGCLAGLQHGGPPRFRWVLHHGNVTATGALTRGEENLMGPDMHFLFRMEPAAKALAHPTLISETAALRLPPTCRLEEAGTCPLKGFEGQHRFFSWPTAEMLTNRQGES